ncbi:MAG: MFS transporter [bacterium]|nr:MFS transporter [bacterium]
MSLLPAYLSHRLPFFYGYLVVAVAILAQICTSPGQTFAISAFTPYLQEHLGLSSSQLAAAYMLGTLLAAVPLTLIGPYSDRFGLRISMLWVASGLSLACFWMSTVQGFTSLLVGFLLLRFLGQGALTLLSSNLISMWFHQRLGRVNAAMSCGIATAFAAVPVLLLASIEQFGWRITYVGLGGLILAALVPLVLLLVKNRPEELGLRPDGLRVEALLPPSSTNVAHTHLAISSAERRLTLGDAVSQRAFWILATGMCLWAMIGTGIVFYALAIFEGFGIPRERSQLMFATFSLSMLLTQVVGGILADRYSMHRLLAVGFGMLAAGAAVLPTTASEAQMHAFAVLFGGGQGLTMAVSSTMWVRYYGRPNLGKIRGAVWCMTVAGSGCGPFVLGLIKDATGDFTLGLWIFAVALLPLGPLALWATPPEIPKGSTEDQDPSVSAAPRKNTQRQSAARQSAESQSAESQIAECQSAESHTSDLEDSLQDPHPEQDSVVAVVRLKA